MKGKVLLAGGGEAEDSLLLDKKFAHWVGPDGKVLYWPFARIDSQTFESCRAWFTETFAPLNLRNITMWSSLTDHRAAELDEFEAVFIGGGNAYGLLAKLLKSGFDQFLIRYVKNGGIVYGGSAGAVILGRDIQSVSHLDPNEINLAETRCLDLAAGYAVWVHYQPKDDKLIRKYIKERYHSVIAISERSGVVIDDTGIQAVGYEPAYIFDNFGKHEI